MFSQLNGPAADPPAALSLFVPQCGGQMRTDGQGWSWLVPFSGFSGAAYLWDGWALCETRNRRCRVEKDQEESAFEMGLKDGEHSRWRESTSQTDRVTLEGGVSRLSVYVGLREQNERR